MKKHVFYLCSGALILLASCTKKAEFTYQLNNLDFVFEAPYAGAETKSAEAILNLDSVFRANKADIKQIKEVNLESVKFEMQNGRNFDNFTGLTVEFMSDKNPTLTVGSMAEVEKGAKEVTFQGSKEADADAFFNEGKFFVMLTSNMKPEDTLSYTVKGNLTFKITAAAKAE
ncbi:MAG: hypothetical protein ACT6QS_04930 [Flavobacteriales bacterium]